VFSRRLNVIDLPVPIIDTLPCTLSTPPTVRSLTGSGMSLVFHRSSTEVVAMIQSPATKGDSNRLGLKPIPTNPVVGNKASPYRYPSATVHWKTTSPSAVTKLYMIAAVVVGPALVVGPLVVVGPVVVGPTVPVVVGTAVVVDAPVVDGGAVDAAVVVELEVDATVVLVVAADVALVVATVVKPGQLP
jgi:hypothetical protein